MQQYKRTEARDGQGLPLHLHVYDEQLRATEPSDGLMGETYNTPFGRLMAAELAKRYNLHAELVRLLDGCVAYIAQSVAHKDRLLNSPQIEAAAKDFLERTASISTGPYWGPTSTAELHKAVAIIAEARAVTKPGDTAMAKP